MTRTLLSLAAALALLLPTIAQPHVVSAGFVDDVAAICKFLGGCAPFGAADDGTCSITAVGASAARDSKGGRVDHFDYHLIDNCGDIHVTGLYAFAGGELSEKLEGNGRSISARWFCSNDPWIYPAGQAPSCSRITIANTGNPAGLDLDALSRATLPLSVAPLSDLSRQTLNGQLQNALNRLPPAGAAAPPPPTATPVPQAVPLLSVQRGANRQGVEAVQYLLRHHGADLTVDGDFGDQTDAAVRAFQQANGLPVNGIVGRPTWEALWVTVKAGDTGSDAVRAVQTLLNRNGQDVAVDGDFGDQTDAAVRALQQKKGLPTDGIVANPTWNVLAAAVVGLRIDPTT